MIASENYTAWLSVVCELSLFLTAQTKRAMSLSTLAWRDACAIHLTTGVHQYVMYLRYFNLIFAVVRCQPKENNDEFKKI